MILRSLHESLSVPGQNAGHVGLLITRDLIIHLRLRDRKRQIGKILPKHKSLDIVGPARRAIGSHRANPIDSPVAINPPPNFIIVGRRTQFSVIVGKHNLQTFQRNFLRERSDRHNFLRTDRQFLQRRRGWTDDNIIILLALLLENGLLLWRRSGRPVDECRNGARTRAPARGRHPADDDRIGIVQSSRFAPSESHRE